MVKYKDYYATLGVERKATDKEIKAAYRKLARQHHPDVNKNEKASEDKFKEITEAYEVLKDPEKRRRYDMLGSNYKAGSDFQPPPDFSGFSFDLGDLGGLGKGTAFSDFFEVLFGQAMSGSQFGGAAGGTAGNPFGGPGAGRGSHRPTHKAQDQEAELELTIEELAKGATRTIQISQPGAKTRTLEVKIPKGIRPGSKVRVPGEGGQSPHSGPGDLYLKVRLKPHTYFALEGDNLISNLEITPSLAVLGGEASVSTLDGSVTLTIPPHTQNGRLLRLRGKGLPKLKQTERSDHLVRIKIVIPKELTSQERELWNELSKLENKSMQRTKSGA